MSHGSVKESAPPSGARLTSVLESALDTFARRGYRKTSMDDVASEARISRPGLYLYFSSKQALLHAAVEHALERDVAEAEILLADLSEPLPIRLLEAFDLWAGQYVGPLATDLDGLLQQDATLLGELPTTYADRFRAAVRRSLESTAVSPSAWSRGTLLTVDEVTDVVLALAAGTKHRAASQDEFRTRLRHGLALLLH